MDAAGAGDFVAGKDCPLDRRGAAVPGVVRLLDDVRVADGRREAWLIMELIEGEAFGESDRITLHYVGVLEDGTLFDSSYERNSPFSYNYGAGMIQGWSRGMEAAQKGLKRRLVVPGPLAYGERVPRGTKLKPNSTLIFAIDVLNVEAGQPAQPLPAPTPAPGTDASKQ